MEKTTKDFIFGLRPVIEAIESGQTVDKILIKKGLTGDLVKELYKAVADYKVPLQHVPIEKIEQITKKNHQGVLAFLSAVEFFDLDTIISDVFSEGKNPFIVVLDQITDVRNLGAIIRSAECAGAHAILVPTKGSARIGADTVKTSAGALYHIPICRTDALPNQIKNLKKSGLQIICGTEKTEENYYNVDLTMPFALIMGSEEFGVSPEIMRLGDSFAKIPINGKIKSLNVSSAASIIMYEAVRQRLIM
ncbi:MAG: 23S rRNA (guanosine(2251)-2'-O)-methyltransferase RlmB [Salinivirgaceae bacterium]|nr:23S rRNA (guanosine(2251)-2'-O)-methyltransferase RlmB [Salinivirgaceae bacterium]MDY0280553.1 23S rRNA (guanosine(2251)-2'-O)-methyltransferase RlmB [Salinivirgaceae bacterium]